MGIKEEFLKEMRYEDLPEHFKLVADSCGIDVAKSLIIELGGTDISIPMAKSIKPAVARFVNNTSKCVPIKKVAIELGCSERYLQKLEERS